MQIFLSHTHADKPVVEPIAIRLREVFGQSQVFYDSWSIQPGDGIIQKMNEGLEAPDFVFFFVSEASLKSKMVEIEWQNALFASTKGKVRIIPVRVDGSPMPPVMMQNVWIDLYAQGIEVALQQIVSVVQGMNTFTPQHQAFSNITYFTEQKSTREILLHVKASHLMEPNSLFLVASGNTESELSVGLAGGMFRSGFNADVIKAQDGSGRLNGFGVGLISGALTPQHPVTIELKQTGVKPIHFGGLFHERAQGSWHPVPARASR
jgi:hypothetical protein